MSRPEGTPGVEAGASTAPDRQLLVLLALVTVSAVCNLNLSVANVALPSIDEALQASQTSLDLVAVGYSLGLAASVLYLGAVGDRYGRKLMLVLGMTLFVPACLLAALAHSPGVLVVARVLGGIAAGMAFPTTLALVTALWSGAARTKAIALWSALGTCISCLGPVSAGLVLTHFYWGSVFLMTLPLVVVALAGAVAFVPSHVNETIEPIDHAGGVLSVVLVGSLVLAINVAAEPNRGTMAVGLAVVALAALVAFVVRQLKAERPLFDLRIARRRIFWVATLAGVIIFGALVAVIFIGQQFLQNVLGYSTLASGAAAFPSSALMIVTAPLSARLVTERGSRLTLLLGTGFCLLAFVSMLVLWREGASYWAVGLSYALFGIGVGLAATPASHALTASVPVERAGMASATADLQRDFGAAIMQSILGALLTAGYAGAIASAVAAAPPAERQQVTTEVEATLQKSFAGAESVAHQYPGYARDITAAAKTSFVKGSDEAYLAAIVAIVVGGALVFFLFPGKDGEAALLAQYAEEDAGRRTQITR